MITLHFLAAKSLPGGWRQTDWQLSAPLPAMAGRLILDDASLDILQHNHDRCSCLHPPTAWVGTHAPWKTQHRYSATIILDEFTAPADEWLLCAAEIHLAQLLRLSQHLTPPPRLCLIQQIQHAWPFQARPSQLFSPHLPAASIACQPMLETRGWLSRLCSDDFQPGCYQGTANEFLAECSPTLHKLPLITLDYPD